MSGGWFGDMAGTSMGDSFFVLCLLPGDCFVLVLVAGDRFVGEGVLFFVVVFFYDLQLWYIFGSVNCDCSQSVYSFDVQCGVVCWVYWIRMYRIEFAWCCDWSSDLSVEHWYTTKNQGSREFFCISFVYCVPSFDRTGVAGIILNRVICAGYLLCGDNN